MPSLVEQRGERFPPIAGGEGTREKTNGFELQVTHLDDVFIMVPEGAVLDVLNLQNQVEQFVEIGDELFKADSGEKRHKKQRDKLRSGFTQALDSLKELQENFRGILSRRPRKKFVIYTLPSPEWKWIREALAEEAAKVYPGLLKDLEDLRNTNEKILKKLGVSEADMRDVLKGKVTPYISEKVLKRLVAEGKTDLPARVISETPGWTIKVERL